MSDTLAITAAAALTPYGLNTEDFMQNFSRTPVAFKKEEGLGACSKNALSVFAASIPEYDTKKILNTRSIRNLDRMTQHLCVALEMLHSKMGFSEMEERRSQVKDERVSLVVGTSGPLQSLLDYDIQTIRDPQFVQPGLFPSIVFNAPASYAAIRRQIKGSCMTLTNGDTTVVEAFGIGAKQIWSGRIDLAIIGGVEEATPAYAAYVKAMTIRQNIPWPAIAEGAYLFSMESTERARANGRPVIATLLGAASVYCPDMAYGLKECLKRLIGSTRRDLSTVQWVCADEPVDLESLGLADRGVISLEKRLGYLGAMYASAGVMALLGTPQVEEGDLALVICANREGSCACLLLEKGGSPA